MTKKRSFPKDVHQLMKSVDSVTAGQVTVGPLEDNSDDDCDQEQKGSITIEVSPSDGAYEGGKFKFEVMSKNITVADLWGGGVGGEGLSLNPNPPPP